MKTKSILHAVIVLIFYSIAICQDSTYLVKEIWPGFGSDHISSNSLKIFALGQNYPNPFNPNTTIEYSIPQQSFVVLKIFDGLGREVVTLGNVKKDAGKYSVRFDASGLPSGVYLYRLQTGSFTQTRKLMLVK